MKRFISLAAALFFATGGLSYAAPEYSLKLGHSGASNHHYQQACELFAEMVKKRTSGAVEITVFPSEQLGKQLEATEGVMIGTHDIILSSDTILSNWAPDMGILNLPFLFNDLKDARTVLDGPVGVKLSALTEPHGAKVIGWWDNGMRHVTNNSKPIKSPADIKGLKIRVPEGEVFVDTIKAMGASPVVMPFREIYSALKLKSVDGQENPPAHIVTQKFYTVQKYVSRTGHIHTASPLIMNKALFEKMPKAYQEAIVQSGREVGPIHTQMVIDHENEQWDELKSFGMEITDVDKAPFREAVKPVIEKYKNMFDGELITEIQQTLGR